MAKPATTVNGLQPYPEYKPSGVEWLGDVPTHWGVAAVKRYYSVQLGKMLQPRPNAPGDCQVRYLKARNVQWFHVDMTHFDQMYASLDEKDRYGVRPGDLLVCEGGEGGRCAVARNMEELANRYIIQNALHRVRPRESNSGQKKSRNDYLQYALSAVSVSGWFDALNDKATISHFTVEKFQAMPVPIPPPPEQAAIARYLDHSARRIRRCIHAKEKLVKLLEEQRQALIDEAITGRIDVRTGQPYPAYKPSGVQWLGDVPAHWEVRQVKRIAQILRGKFTHRPRNDPSLYDGRYPFIQTGEVARAETTIMDYRQTLNERGFAVSKMFPAGTLVMTIAANIGDVAVLDFEACFPDSIVGFVPRSALDRDFLYYVFRAMKSELLREAPVNTQGNLNVDRIGSRRIALPPTIEQRRIVQQIVANSAKLGTAINRARRQVKLLSEFHTRLIADVVTGKLDVRPVAAQFPVKIEEPESLAGSAVQTDIGGESDGEVDGAT